MFFWRNSIKKAQKKQLVTRLFEQIFNVRKPRIVSAIRIEV
jgi:hypothetical protein